MELSGQNVSSEKIAAITKRLQANNLDRLSLRDCRIRDSDFKQLVTALSICGSIVQLSLSLGCVDSQRRVELLAKFLTMNRSLQSLFLHGNPLHDVGVKTLCEALLLHPNVTSVDFGDCRFGDAGLHAVCTLLKSRGAKLGLEELVLSANPDITSRGWAQFSMALATKASLLRALYMDYNVLGDYSAGCLATALAGNQTLEVLDLEGTQITELSAKLFLHLIKTYPVPLRTLVLTENKVRKSTVEHIRTLLCSPSNMETALANDTNENSRTTDNSDSKQSHVRDLKLKPLSYGFSENDESFPDIGTLTSDLPNGKSTARDRTSKAAMHYNHTDKNRVTETETCVINSINQRPQYPPRAKTRKHVQKRQTQHHSHGAIGTNINDIDDDNDDDRGEELPEIPA